MSVRLFVCSDAENFARVGDFTLDRGCSHHGWAHQQRATGRRALAALEVTIAARGAELRADELIGVHGPAHRETRLTELEAGLGEDLVVARLDGGLLHLV